MKTLITLIFSSLAFFSSAAAQTSFAYLSDLKLGANPTVQAYNMELVKPSVAVARGQIPSSDARHYKMVFLDQLNDFQTLKVSPKASVTLLIFPNLTPKTASLEHLRLMLNGDDALPSEFEVGNTFKYTLTNQVITSITQINTRTVTGVFEQAVMISIGKTFRPLKLVLNFVNIYTTKREARRVGKIISDNYPPSWIISDQNSLLRSFKLAQNGRIILFSSTIPLIEGCLSGVDATLAQLEKGLNGKGTGWDFPDLPFWATISDVTNEVLELRQTYGGC
jgi:hypothetical protein